MNIYNTKLDDYLREMPSKMFSFEVTKSCNYSTFIFMYKNETLFDLYNRVSHHFDLNHNIKLFFRIPHHDDDIIIPNTPLQTVRTLLNEYITSSPPRISPIYDMPLPIVYRIYLDDRDCCASILS